MAEDDTCAECNAPDVRLVGKVTASSDNPLSEKNKNALEAWEEIVLEEASSIAWGKFGNLDPNVVANYVPEARKYLEDIGEAFVAMKAEPSCLEGN
jgi:hypothetical protein